MPIRSGPFATDYFYGCVLFIAGIYQTKEVFKSELLTIFNIQVVPPRPNHTPLRRPMINSKSLYLPRSDSGGAAGMSWFIGE